MQSYSLGTVQRHFEAHEHVTAIPARFFKLGGTWDMVLRNGHKIGFGGLDDNQLGEMECRLGCYDRLRQVDAEKRLAIELYARFQAATTESFEFADHLLSSWVGAEFGRFVNGPFIPLFSGDSSHFRSSIVAPMIAILIESAIREPTTPILGAQGTDTADIALMGPFDVLTFDTDLPPLILTGANRSHKEPGSDAPGNFVNLARSAHFRLGAGAYWVFQKYLYHAADIAKIDPEESRSLEDQSTFLAPHKTNQLIQDFKLDGDSAIYWRSRRAPKSDHLVHKVTAQGLYEAFDSIRTYDLGDQNPRGILSQFVDDPSVKAIVAATHSLGNVDNITRYELVRAARNGKLVIGASRTLISATREAYAASLFAANGNPKELGGSANIIISAHKLSKSMARAIAARALLEGLDQTGTQQLLDKYADARDLR